MNVQRAHVNGHPALLVQVDGRIDTVVTARFDHGFISGVYAVRNPDKLIYIERESSMTR